MEGVDLKVDIPRAKREMGRAEFFLVKLLSDPLFNPRKGSDDRWYYRSLGRELGISKRALACLIGLGVAEEKDGTLRLVPDAVAQLRAAGAGL